MASTTLAPVLSIKELNNGSDNDIQLNKLEAAYKNLIALLNAEVEQDFNYDFNIDFSITLN